MPFDKSALVLPALLPLIGCAPLSPPVRSISPEVDRAVASAARQVRGCYRAPRVPTSGRRIATRLRVRYGVDGRLAGLPAILSQDGVTADNRPYAARMAEAASLAVIRCSPVSLPPELHRGGWEEIDLTFSPSALG